MNITRPDIWDHYSYQHLKLEIEHGTLVIPCQFSVAELERLVFCAQYDDGIELEPVASLHKKATALLDKAIDEIIDCEFTRLEITEIYHQVINLDNEIVDPADELLINKLEQYESLPNIVLDEKFDQYLDEHCEIKPIT